MEVVLVILLVLALVGLFLLWKFYSKGWERKWREREGSYREEIVRRQGEALEERDEALRRLREELGQLMKTRLEDSDRSHAQGLARQKGEIWGKAAERLAPLFGEWRLRYNPADLVLVNNTVDYLVLVGRSEESITEVVFQEVKSGTSGLLPKKGRQSRAKRTIQDYLRECIEDRKVRWETWRFDEASGELFMDLPPGSAQGVQKLLDQGADLKEAFKMVLQAQKEGKEVIFEKKEGK